MTRKLLLLVLLSSALGAQAPLTLAGLDTEAPLTLTASATTENLILELSLEKGWHVYARDVGGGQPVTITFDPDSEYQKGGELLLPEDDHGKLSGKVKIIQPLVRKSGGKRLNATFQFMTCDPVQCLPPMEVTIAGVPGDQKPAALRVLLVVSKRDEHAARLDAFLKERQFLTTLTTYKEVDRKTCDAADVVLADSKLFRQTDGALEQAMGFPKTSAPVVAVGFLGTELLQGQGIAMTSGYI